MKPIHSRDVAVVRQQIGADKIAESFYCRSICLWLPCARFNTYGPSIGARGSFRRHPRKLYAERIRLGTLERRRDLMFVSIRGKGSQERSRDPASGQDVQFLGHSIETRVQDLAQRNHRADRQPVRSS